MCEGCGDAVWSIWGRCVKGVGRLSEACGEGV